MKRLFAILVPLMIALAAWPRSYEPSEIVNPIKADKTQFIADPENLLSESDKAEINSRLEALRSKTTAEMAVVVVPSVGDSPIEDWSEQLFTSWGIGKKDKDNGVLLVIAVDDRKARIQTGYGVEGVLPDISCAAIIRDDIAPAMRDGNLALALNNAVSTVYGAFTDPAVAEELRSSQADDEEEFLSPEVLRTFAYCVGSVALLFSVLYFIHDGITCRRMRKDRYAKAALWRSHLLTYLFAGILSLGTGLIFWLLAFLLYRYYRNFPRKCPTCGKRMKRLPENKDNELLNAAQDLEEKLGSVDYDVWECPSCGTVERFPFRENQKRYTECPACGTVAMGLLCDAVLVPPTTRSEGHGERVYQCRYCGHQKKTPYKIPRKDGGTGAIVAGAVVGSMLGRGGGGGGGFSGGSFGGGATGGGGASGGW